MIEGRDSIIRSPGFGRNLTFRNCNLVNVKTYPDWVVDGCNTSQAWQIVSTALDGTEELNPQVIGRCVNGQSKFGCIKSAELLEPPGALTGRNF